MVNMKKTIILVGIAISFVLSLLVKSWMDWGFYSAASYENFSEISRAYEKYMEKIGERPTSLDQLVKNGFLPEFAPYYRSFLKEGSFSKSAISFRSREYVCDFSDVENPRIIVPKEHLKRLWISRGRKSHDLVIRLNK